MTPVMPGRITSCGPSDRAASGEVLKFFDWAFRNGKQLALDLDYVPLPDNLTQQIRDRVWSQITTRSLAG